MVWIHWNICGKRKSVCVCMYIYLASGANPFRKRICFKILMSFRFARFSSGRNLRLPQGPDPENETSSGYYTSLRFECVWVRLQVTMADKRWRPQIAPYPPSPSLSLSHLIWMRLCDITQMEEGWNSRGNTREPKEEAAGTKLFERNHRFGTLFSVHHHHYHHHHYHHHHHHHRHSYRLFTRKFAWITCLLCGNTTLAFS